MLGVRLALCLAVLLSAPLASALSVNHGTYVGINTRFVDVTETTLSAGDSECLFTSDNGNPNDGVCASAPTLSGDQLLFFPTAFTATTTGGGSDTTGSRLEITLQSKPNESITEVWLNEFGDTVLSGLGTATTATLVTLTGSLTITEANFAPITAVVIPFAGTFAPKGNFDLPTDPGTTLWSGSFTIDVASQVANATEAVLSFDNELEAVSEAGSSATIQKKVLSGPVLSVAVIPEPGTASLLGLGLLGLAAARRRH